MKVAVTPLTRKYAQGKFRFFTLINVIPDVVAAAAGHANWSFSRSPLIFLLLLASPPPAAQRDLTCTSVRSMLCLLFALRRERLKINFPRMAD